MFDFARDYTTKKEKMFQDVYFHKLHLWVIVKGVFFYIYNPQFMLLKVNYSFAYPWEEINLILQGFSTL